jgi:hypothetical protein
VRRQRGRQVAPCGHTSTVGQRFLRLVHAGVTALPCRRWGWYPVGTARPRPEPEPEMPASARTCWIPRTSRRRRGTPAAPEQRRAGSAVSAPNREV